MLGDVDYDATTGAPFTEHDISWHLSQLFHRKVGWIQRSIPREFRL